MPETASAGEAGRRCSVLRISLSFWRTLESKVTFEDCLADSMTHAKESKEKSARFRKGPLQRYEDIRNAPRGRQFLMDEGCIRRAFHRKGGAWGKPSWDSKAARDRRRSGRAAWWRGRVRQTSWTSCTSFLRRRRAPR